MSATPSTTYTRSPIPGYPDRLTPQSRSSNRGRSNGHNEIVVPVATLTLVTNGPPNSPIAPHEVTLEIPFAVSMMLTCQTTADRVLDLTQKHCAQMSAFKKVAGITYPNLIHAIENMCFELRQAIRTVIRGGGFIEGQISNELIDEIWQTVSFS
jgi:hypothetical protein